MEKLEYPSVFVELLEGRDVGVIETRVGFVDDLAKFFRRDVGCEDPGSSDWPKRPVCQRCRADVRAETNRHLVRGPWPRHRKS